MSNRFTLRLSVVLALCGAAVRGQDAAQPAPGAREDGGISPEMRRLDFLVSKSTIEGKLYLSGGAPRELTGRAAAMWTIGGGYLLIQSTTRGENLPVREALRLIGYDAQAKQYRAWSFTSGSAVASEWVGNFEGEKLVLTLQPNLAAGVVGLGGRIEPAPEGVRLLGVEPGGPADKAGLRAGDLITRIDGVAVPPATRDPVPDLRGKVGTSVRLTVRTGTQERDLAIIRAVAPPTRMTLEPRSMAECQLGIETQQEGRWARLVELTFRSAP